MSDNKKRLFQVFDEMNVNDDKNKTATLGCCFDMVEAKTVKAGGIVTMGVPKDEITKIFLGDRQPILLLMDRKEYRRLEAIPVEDKLQAAEEKAERYEKALKEIANWQLPETGRYWDHGTNLEPMSYEACYGSNGVRDYFKALAASAITPKTGGDE